MSSRSPSTSSSRLTVSSRSGGSPRTPASILRRRPSHQRMPSRPSRGWLRFWRFETFDEPASRPSRTVWMSLAPGKRRISVGLSAIVKQLISISPGLPASAATGQSRSRKRLRQARSTFVPTVRSKSATAASKRSRSTTLCRPRTLRPKAIRRTTTGATSPARIRRHQNRFSLRRNCSGVTCPASRSGKPCGLTWKRASIGTRAQCEWLERSCETTWVPERPVPPTNSRSGFSGRSAARSIMRPAFP